MSLKINTERGNKGRGYWKLNASIMNNEEYVYVIKKLISKYEKELTNCDDLGILWDNLKIEVRDASLDYCKRKAKVRKDEINVLETKLNNLNNKINDIIV